MFGTLSMIALVVSGASGVSPLVVPALALANAMVGLPHMAQATGGAVACRFNGLAKALPLQLVFCGVGYLLGVGFRSALVWIG